jgi:hypothetical protein
MRFNPRCQFHAVASRDLAGAAAANGMARDKGRLRVPGKGGAPRSTPIDRTIPLAAVRFISRKRLFSASPSGPRGRMRVVHVTESRATAPDPDSDCE